MCRIGLIAAAGILGLGAIAAAADEPSGRAEAGQPTAPSANGTLSSDLNRSGGVITPPTGIDPKIKQTPPDTGARMPIIPPPGAPGGNPDVKPK